MSIFTRVHDIISSNINAMLDKAEDPEKLVKLIIREMEDTLVEIKASCASAMAKKKHVERESEAMATRAREWEDRAQLAVNKNREDLAREALLEKRRYTERGKALETESLQFDEIIQQYQEDIVQLRLGKSSGCWPSATPMPMRRNEPNRRSASSTAPTR